MQVAHKIGPDAWITKALYITSILSSTKIIHVTVILKLLSRKELTFSTYPHPGV